MPQETIKQISIMKEKHIPVGIYDREIYFVRLEEDGKLYCGIDGEPVFDVIRPVTENDLELLRDTDERRDEYKDFWKQAVAADATEESFDDWLDRVWEEDFDENDPEDFPGKDSSDCQYLTEDFRLAADAVLQGKYGITVGTWESAGGYPPTRSGRNNFKKWDYVFDAPLSRKYAKDYEDSLKK